MDGNISPPSTRTSSGWGPQTPIVKNRLLKSVGTLKDLKNAHTLGEMMSDYGLSFNDKAAFERYPLFKDKIFNIIGGDRSSGMKPESHKKFEAYLDCYARYNEATFLKKIFPLLMKDGLHLREGGNWTEAEKQQLGQPDYLEYRDFLIDEGIVESADRDFLRTMLPSSCNKECETYMAKVLAKVAGMVNPKPDYTFGIKRDRLPPIPENIVPGYINGLLNIAPGTRHAFLIVEGKPYNGVKADAENQVRRGGATLVNAARTLRGIVEKDADKDDPDADAPDENSFVFSVVMSPDVVEFWVHWYEGKGQRQEADVGKYHMNRLASRNLVEEDNRKDIRRMMHNIMEWGGIHSQRYRDLLDFHKSILAYVQNEHETTIAAAHAKPSSRSPRKRQRPDSSIEQEEEGGSLPGY